MLPPTKTGHNGTGWCRGNGVYGDVKEGWGLMREAEIYREQIADLSAALAIQTTEIADDLLYTRPGAKLNPVGFLYWHLLRVWDFDLALSAGTSPTEDIWHRGDYAERSGYQPDGLGLRGTGMGVGYTDAQVDAVRVPTDILIAYHQQLLAETTALLATADDATLRASRPSPANPGQQITGTARLQHTVSHSHGHLGEIRFIKGMLGFPDPSYPR